MSTLGEYFKKFRPERSSNLKVVVLCVVTAATFWLLNALNKDDYTTVVNQPIFIAYNSDEYMAVEEVPSTVKIEVHGNGWDLLKRHLQISVTPLTLNLEDPSRQDYLATDNIRRQLSDHLSSTELVSVVQDTIFYKIDKIVSKKIEVVLDTTESILANYHEFGPEINIDPPSVMVTGPISKIDQLQGKIMVSLQEDNIQQNFSKLLPIELDKEQSSFLTLDEETVQVSFEVFAFLEGNKRLRINKRYFPGSVDIAEEEPFVIFNYLVDERKLEELGELELEAVLNFNNRNREDSTVAVSLNVNPDYIRILSFNPDKFRLIYE